VMMRSVFSIHAGLYRKMCMHAHSHDIHVGLS